MHGYAASAGSVENDPEQTSGVRRNRLIPVAERLMYPLTDRRKVAIMQSCLGSSGDDMQFDRLKRREFITLVGGAAVAWPLGALGQQPGKLPLIGVLVSASPPHPFADAFWRGLHALGYSEGQNIKVEFRYTEGRSDRAEEFAEEFVRAGVNVIVAHYAIGTAAAMAATRTIPIVMAPHGAPLQLGVINSLARPGGNVTGLSAMDAEIGGKRVQLLRELIPNLSRIAVLATTSTTSPFGPPFVEDLRLAATSASLGFKPILIGGSSEFRSAFAEMGKANVQAVVVQPFFDPYRGILIDLASKYRLPYMSGNQEVTAAGGLVSMAANWSQLFERAAFYVDKILKGAKPGDLPVEQPTKFVVTLNMKTAQALGLTISPTLLAQIDEVID
jgi:putative tryptophan/tyrosine transport system substrate-binding protein